MAYPTSQHGSPHGSGKVTFSPALSTPRCHFTEPPHAEGEHQLEKLQFALAVALTRGDHTRSQYLRDQIAALGEDLEEPGT
jgi:hypothetical protein